MNHTEFFSQLMPIIISLLGALLTYRLIPWIKGKVDEQDLAKAEYWISIAVTAAEQIFKDKEKSGNLKKQYVIEFLKTKGVTITEQELDAMIEAAVYEISQASELLFKALDMDEEGVM